MRPGLISYHILFSVYSSLISPKLPPAGGMPAGGMSEWRLVRLKERPHGCSSAGEMSANQITESLNSIG